MAIDETDLMHMRRALELAAKGRGMTSPNPMVGAVVVKDGVVVGEGWHHRAGEAHAEVNALIAAGAAARDATVYVSLEPCCHHGRTPPCTDALIAAGVRRVVAAMIDPNLKVAGQGVAALREAGIVVEVGALEREARDLNEQFVIFHTLGRPFVTIKWAMTLDGRTGSDSGHSRWISNETSRGHVHQLRADHDAILIGIGTVLADDPMLNVRIEGYSGRQPVRIVVDGDLSIPRRARMLRERDAGPVVFATTPHASESARRQLEEDGHRVVIIPGRRRLVELAPLLEWMAQERMLSVLAEGGRQIQTSLIQQDLADKVVAYIAPKIIGGTELRSPVEGLGLTSMDEALVIKRPVWKSYGEDICLEGYLRDC